MVYYICCLVILLLFLFCLLHEIMHEIKKHRASLFIISYCLLLTLLFKYNYGIEFWGLEYEDAYSFSFCARQFSHNIYPTSFLIDAVCIGSLDTPISIFTYGGHFITYPAFLSIFTQILGWSPQLISIINAFTAFGILLLLSLLSKNKFWFLAPSIYCAAPIINVFTNCFLSEIFSSFVCLTFVFAYLRTKTRINSCLCFLAFGLALLCKRENLALLIIPTIDSMICWFRIRKDFVLGNVVKRTIPYIAIVGIYLSCCQNVFEIEGIESKDIGEATFSFGNFERLFPVFIKSLFSIHSFSITFSIYIIYLLYIGNIKYEYNKTRWISFFVFTSYLLLYTFHYRGYFFIKDGYVDSFETYRYINNFFYLIPLIFCSFSINRAKLLYVPIIILMTFSFFQTNYLRRNFSSIEKENRFDEVEIVSTYIESQNKSSLLISENILLYQNLCKSNFSICDITLINELRFDKEINYFCLLPNIEYMKERYGIILEKDDFIPVLLLPNGNYLYRYFPKCI